MIGLGAALGGLFAGAALFTTPVNAQATSIDPIIVKGKHFFYSTNHTQFYIRGVAYQQNFNPNATSASNADFTDPLADESACNRDIPYLKQLRTNVIRTYAVNPSLDHSGCMNALAAAGIYVISDLGSPSESINRNSPSWTVDLFQHYAALIDDLSQYDNVIGFFAGNEVANSPNTTASSAFVKAAVRDSKYYISQNVKRPLYVGYATADVESIRDQIASYMNCGDAADAIDFYGYNIYSWCGDSSYQTSGYAQRTQFYQDYSVPVFFAEYGCNTVEPRPFTEVQALFSSPMTSVWSGGIVYQYFQSANNYGLIQLSGNSVSRLPGFSNYQSQISKISPSSTAYGDVDTATLSPFACPTVGASWEAKATPLPYRPNADLCNCVGPSLGCVVDGSTPVTDYGDLFGYICGLRGGLYCLGTTANATLGDYGVYGMCDASTQLSYVMNKYFEGQDSNPSACAFSGAAHTQATQTPTGTCASLVAAAGSNGLGNAPSGLSTQSATDTPNGARGGVASLDLGVWYTTLYVLLATATGAGMLIL